MAIGISISITQNSQNIANNTSNVTVTVTAAWTYGSYNTYQQSGVLTIDGTQYSFTSSFNENATTSGSQELYTKTVDVSHNSDGTKTLSCTASYISGVSSGTVTASAANVLSTIARASSATAADGTLGAEHTITVHPTNSTFKHKIYYVFNGVTKYIAGSSSTYMSGTSVVWTPPLELAVKNTTGTSLSFWFNLQTYTSGGTLVGTVSPQITLAIPSSVKPSCTIAVKDANGLEDQYGNPIKGLSELAVTITPTTSYGADIAAYKATVDGVSYTTASFITSVLKSSGTLKISATVTDKRGRSGSVSSTKTVLDYTAPAVKSLTVKRCNQDGTENMQGAYIMATFSGTVTALNNKNSAQYTLRYKKTSASTYTSVSFSALSGSYVVADQTYIFAADTGSAYDVELAISDNFNTSTRKTSASTAFAIMHFNAAGKGVAIGKVSESDCLEVAMDAKFTGDISVGDVPLLNYIKSAYSNATTSAAGLMSAADKSKLAGTATVGYGTCSTSASTAAKSVTCSGFTLSTGSRVSVKFTYSNTNTSATLNVNGTGAKSIRTGSAVETIKTYTWPAGATVEFCYNGTYWVICAPISGTWTPTVKFGNTNATSYVYQDGHYSKIGNMVTLSFRIRCTAPTTGEIAISGFASTCGNAEPSYSGGGVFLPIFPYSSNYAGFIGFQMSSATTISPIVASATADSFGIYSATGQGVSGASVYLYGTIAYLIA